MWNLNGWNAHKKNHENSSKKSQKNHTKNGQKHSRKTPMITPPTTKNKSLLWFYDPELILQ
jgi:hypothetical protein